MRTTLSLEDEVAQQLAELAHTMRRSFKEVVNETLRRGLEQQGPPEPAFEVRPHAGHLRAGIDDRKLNELAWAPDLD